MSNASVYPFFTYAYDNRIYTSINPFITYYPSKNLQQTLYPFITYKYDGTATEYQYYFTIYVDNHIVKCKMYESTVGFPLFNTHLSCICNDGIKRYVPLDILDSDYDSGLRVKDEYNNEFQLCVERPKNIIKTMCPYGNLIIPMDENLYESMYHIFGTTHVQKKENSVLFRIPSKSSGITRLFLIGLNASIKAHSYTLTTAANGLNNTSYGGDTHWIANCMLLDLIENEWVELSYKNKYKNKQYTNELVKNACVIGNSIEHLEAKSSSYMPLINSTMWYVYDNGTIYQTHDKVNYFKRNILLYPNSPHCYNYYDLKEMMVR